MQYKVSPNNIQLKSSFEVKKDDFDRELAALREQHPECLVWKRTLASLKMEWAVHNALYAMGFLRKRTSHTDLNWPQSWLFRIGYAIVGKIVWPFIK